MSNAGPSQFHLFSPSADLDDVGIAVGSVAELVDPLTLVERLKRL